MTDRVRALTVILEKDMREDDIQYLANAIQMFRWVAKVEMRPVNSNDVIAKIQAQNEIRQSLLDVIMPSKG